MADYLPPVIQDFIANVAGYVGPLQEAIAAAEEFAGSQRQIEAATARADAAIAIEGGRLRDLRDMLAITAGSTRALEAGEQGLAGAMDIKSLAAEVQAGRMRDLWTCFVETAAAAVTMARAEMVVREALDQVTARVLFLISVQRALTAGFYDAGSAAVVQAGRLSGLHEQLAITAGASTELAVRELWLSEVMGEKTGAARDQDAALKDLRDVYVEAAATANAFAASEARAAGSAAAAGAAARTAGNSWRIWGTGLRLTGAAIHAIIAVSAELLAVIIPATVAAGAWAAAWLQGATNVVQHMNAVYTATEATANMFHTTAGQAVGLGNALQKAQDAANPDVYQALGGAINIVREHFSNLAGVGLQVGKIFDTFVAKLVYDMSAAGGAGGKLDSVLSHMVPDLVGIGQLFGNIGHALLNFAAAMPGLAEVLLGAVAGLSKLVLVISSIPAPIITAVMALEEFSRWGGFFVTVLGRMGLATTALTGRFFSLERFAGILRNVLFAPLVLIPRLTQGFGALVRAISPAGSAINRLGVNIAGLGADAETAVAGLGFLEVAVAAVAAVGVGFLIYKLATARSAAQQFADSLQQAADKASNLQVLNVLASNMGALAAHAAQAQGAVHRLTHETTLGGVAANDFGHAIRGSGSVLQTQQAAVQTYTAAQQQLAHQFVIVSSHAAQLSSQYHTSLVGALVLADTAGVKLNQTLTKQSWAMAQIKIADLVQGYKSMGQPLGVVGKDMSAVAIASGLTASKVGQLNQAWDTLMTNITGGTQSLGSLVNSIRNIGQVTQSQSSKLGQFGGQFTLTMNQSARAMQSFGQKGSQVWQNFDQVLNGSDQQLADWLRTAGTMGAITGPQLTTAFRGMVSQLLPFTKHSKTAVAELSQLAQEANGPATDSFKKLKQWVDAGKHSTQDMNKVIQDGTIKMGNMSAVAQQLGNVMQNDIIAAMDSAKLKVSGVSAATAKYIGDLRNQTATTAAGRGDRAKLIKDLEFTGLSAKKAADLVRILAGNISGLHSKTVTVTTHFATTGGNGGVPGFTNPGPPPARVHGSSFQGSPIVVHQHVHGSVVTEQQLVRNVQAGLLRKTLRNGSTQTFIPGRTH